MFPSQRHPRDFAAGHTETVTASRREGQKGCQQGGLIERGRLYWQVNGEYLQDSYLDRLLR